MSVRSAQSITTVFTTRRFDTGAATNGDSTPTGTLYVNGTADAASVIVTNLATGKYKAAVTLPTLALGDVVSLVIAATVNSITDNAKIWEDSKDVFAGALPDVVAGGAGGLFIAGSNAATTVSAFTCTNNFTVSGNWLTTGTTTWTGAAAFSNGLTSNITGTLATVTTLTNLPAITASWLTAAGIATDAITAAKIADGAIDTATFASGTTIPRVTLVDTITTYTGDTPQTGDVYAQTNSGTFGLAAIKGYVDDIGVAGAGLTALGDTRIANLDTTVSSRLATSGYTAPLSAAGTRTAVGLATASLDVQLATLDADILTRLASASYTTPDNTSITAIKAKTDNLPASPAAVGSAMTLSSAYDFAKGTVAMTEAYAANGVAPTPVQALYAIQQYLTTFTIASTAYTVKKLDGSTTAFIVTINDATTPTGATRT